MNNKQIPKNRSDMIRLLRNSIDSCQPDLPNEIDDEQIALLASGQLGRLPEEKQKILLMQIASDPIAAELVKDLQELNLDETIAVTTTKIQQLHRHRILRSVAAGWALAACLMIGLFVWRTVEPAAVEPIRTYNADQPDYWTQVYYQRLSQMSRQDRYREYALVASTFACVILSAGLVICIITNRPRKFDKKT